MKAILFVVLLAACNATLRGGHSHVDGGYKADAGEGDTDADATTDAASDGAAAITASQLVTNYDMKYCDAAFACKSNFPGTGSQFTTDFGTSATNCYALSAQVDLPTVIDADVTSGVIHYDPVMGAACVAGLAYTCGTFWTAGPTDDATCQAAIMGTVADGGACNVDWDCVKWTSYCDQNAKKCTAGM